ncbi:MAG: YgcG family protein [Synechococcales cyanobacterium CRU_2_2]|nr:YgcG family protein [Synechococcales cyanobacterium CRU_2_2]
MKLPQSSLLSANQPGYSALAIVLSILLAGLLALAGPFASAAIATGIYDIDPVHAGESTWIVDQSDVLSRFKQGQISTRLEQISEQTGTEIRFVVFRRLDYGETIQSFTSSLFDTWFPTEEEAKSQILIGLDTLTNTTAIRVGRQAQELLSDAIATSIVEETMMAPIRQGDQYNQSLLDASDRLVAVLSGQADPGPPVIEDKLNVEGTFASQEETQESNATVVVIVLLIVATVVPMVTYFVYVR